MIQVNWTQIIGGLSAYILTAIISTMPEKNAPLSWRTFYAWLYDAAHMALNSRNRSANPTPPNAAERNQP